MVAEKRLTSSFDTLDYQIVQELRRLGRADSSKIARAIGANERTVRKRIDRLVSREVIRFAVIINPRAVGYVTAIEIFLEVAPEHEDEAVEQLLAMHEVAYLANGLGERDMVLLAHFQDNDAMRRFLRRTLPAIPGVKVTGSMLVSRVLRDVGEWTPKYEELRSNGRENS